MNTHVYPERFPLRKKIALLSLVSAFVVALFAVPAANAAYIFGSINQFQARELCRTAPDVLTYKIKIGVKFKTSGVKKPKKVRIGYQVMDTDTKKVLRSGVMNLKKSKGYKGKTRRITALANQSITYHITGKYTVGGGSAKTKFTEFDNIPSVEQMDTAGIPNC